MDQAMAAALTDAVMDRSAWMGRMQDLRRRTQAELLDLMEADYRHESGPRGCSFEAAVKEVGFNLETWMMGLGDGVRDGLADRIL